MSDEMAVTDSVSGEENKTTSNTVEDASAVDVAETSSHQTIEAVGENVEETSAPAENESVPQLQVDIKVEVDEGDPQEIKDEIPDDCLNEPVLDQPQPELETEPVKVEPQANPVMFQLEPKPEAEPTIVQPEPEPVHGIKRRLSETFSNVMDEQFKGFVQAYPDASFVEYQRVLERLETEIQSANKNVTRVKSVVASPLAVSRAAKRPRQDTDGSRPSSGLSSRSDEDGTGSTDGSGRRQSRPLTSPLLRVPLERGWKRELVYRATCDSHMRRNADIYYYTPAGKKLRSMREVSEHLSGTGLSLDNFSFFKDLLGMNDPEKEIIRDAKVRRVESPVSAPPSVESKRTPKPKPPRGASPQPALKSPPAKIKVKSLGSRLNNSASSPVQAQPTTPKQKKAAPTTPADNNNTAAWKKPRQPQPQAAPQAVPQAVPHVAPQAVLHVTPQAAPHVAPPVTPPQPPPPLQSRPPVLSSPESPISTGRAGVVQPCSMSCGRGAVPSLSCGACLCLYHPACVGRPHHATGAFLCQNCKPLSPSQDPPPLTHKSGIMTNPSLPVPVPKRIPVAPPASKQKGDQRVLLRMKKSGGAHGQRVWAVSQTTPATTIATPVSQSPVIAPLSIVKQSHVTQTQVTQTQVTPTHVTKVTRSVMPQSLAILNGKRFIVVPRSVISANTTKHEKVTRSRLANGASPPATLSPRRRAPRKVDTDHFTPFYRQAEKNNYNVALQIFSYVGMRELARSAQVCRLWRDLVAQPALWRHVRMKNSHVSDWGGLCAALKRHGTKRLDLRKMLLPHNDAQFWEQFATHIPTIDTLERIEMCRCPANAVEAVCRVTGLVSLSALAIRDALLDPAPLGALRDLHELRLKSMAGLSLTGDLRPLRDLTCLRHLSLTSIKDLGWCACEVVGDLPLLESLELGECTFKAEFAGVVSRLRHLRRLRLERGTAQCAAPALLRALATLPHLQRLELVNVDVKVGFDDALAECKNIQRLLIIPTYVSQSATTNKQVLSGVLRLKDTLTHLMWGVTIELLRVTELFIDQCDQSGETKKKDIGECIPVLKPVPGCKLPDEHHPVAGPPQVEILPLPTLQRLLSAQMPNTKLKLLRIPFHATWRQTLADFH